MEKKFTHEIYHGRANNKNSDVIDKRGKSLGTLRVIEKRRQTTKPQNLRFIIDSNFNQNVWGPRRPNTRGGDEVAAIDSELLFTNIEMYRWSAGYLKNYKRRSNSSTE